MKTRSNFWYHPVAVDVRLTLYAIFLAVGTYFVFFDRTEYYCNLPGQECLFCGMKTAVYHLLHLRFLLANDSNPFVWILVVVGVAIVIDIALMIAHQKTHKITMHT